MPGSSWALTTLGTLCEQSGGTLQTGPFGSQLHAHDYEKDGEVPVVPTSAIGRRRLLDENVERIGRAKANELARHYLRPGDIVFARRGAQATGLSALVEDRHDGWLCGTGAIRLRLNPTHTDPEFISFVLASEATNRWIRHHAIGATMPNLNESVIRGIPVYLPPLSEQRAVAALLGSLDARIELNRRMNETLEELARTIFKSWFVDFDPVRAKVQAGQPAGMDAETAALFPSRFVESELGELPANWSVRPVYELASYINGAAYRDFHFCPPSDGLPIVKIAELKAGVTEQTKFTNTVLDERYRIDTGDMLFSWSGNPDTSIDTFIWTRGPGWLNQHIFKVVPRKANERLFVYRLLRHLRPVFAETARNKQTTGLGHVTAGDMKRLIVAVPSEPLLDAFDNFIGPLHARWYGNLLESQTLAELRDLLLPKLISGELRVPTAEKMVETVL